MNVNQTSALAPLAGAPIANASAKAAEAPAAFAAALQSAMPLTAQPQEEQRFVSGRIMVETDRRGQPAVVRFLDGNGQSLQATAFSAPEMLRAARRNGIDLTDLRGIGTQLDAAGIGYRPYDLYRGTGSDHGIDFEDLIGGGLGTAYDWRIDPNVAAKGPYARQQLAADQALAAELGLVVNPAVTTGGGIDFSRLLPRAGSAAAVRVEAVPSSAAAVAATAQPVAPTTATAQTPASATVAALTPVATMATPTTSPADDVLAMISAQQEAAPSVPVEPLDASADIAAGLVASPAAATSTSPSIAVAETIAPAQATATDPAALLEQLRALLLSLSPAERERALDQALRDLMATRDTA